MKYTLQGCQHRATQQYGPVSGVQVTCPSCYRRLSVVEGALVDAPPPGPCAHEYKKPVGQALTAHRDYTDAMCLSCGCVLRHPDGPGEWEPVIFYGFIIKEEPWQ